MASDPFPQISHEAQIAARVEHLFWNELKREGFDGEWHLLTSKTVGLIDPANSFDLTILGRLSPRRQHRAFLEWIYYHLKRHRIPAQREATLQGDLSVLEVLLSRSPMYPST